MRAPPLSAVFSPRVSRPLSLRSSTATKLLYSSAMQLARFSNSVPSCAVHQSRRLPCGIELAALIVKAMGQFVADDDSDAAEIGGVVGLLVEKRAAAECPQERQFHSAEDCNKR